MSEHAIDRILQRYGKEFSYWDIRNIIKAIKSGKCYILDATREDRIIVLLHYNNLPMKIVYSAGQHSKGCIVTALPLDVDEWNANLSQIPDIVIERKKNKRP